MGGDMGGGMGVCWCGGVGVVVWMVVWGWHGEGEKYGCGYGCCGMGVVVWRCGYGCGMGMLGLVVWGWSYGGGGMEGGLGVVWVW